MGRKEVPAKLESGEAYIGKAKVVIFATMVEQLTPEAMTADDP